MQAWTRTNEERGDHEVPSHRKLGIIIVSPPEEGMPWEAAKLAMFF